MQKFVYNPPQGIPDIIWDNEDYLAINKPSGLLSNPGIALETKDCALSRIQTLHPETILTHRLDCDTSGILVFAKHKIAESHLKKAFQYRDVKKEYIAIIRGEPKENSGVIEANIGPDTNNRPLQKVTVNGKEAITHYEVISSGMLNRQAITKVLLKPQTGRTHQLRVHMDYIGHTIVGDQFYGSHYENDTRLLLHAQALSFTDQNERSITITCPNPFNLIALDHS